MTSIDCTTPVRKCTICGIHYPATTEYFYRKTRGLYGLYSWCKTCHKKRTTPNVVKWQRNNPVAVSNTHRKYRKQHPERVRERDHEKYLRFPEKRAMRGLRYRTRKKSLAFEFTQNDWQRALTYFNGCCAVCGRQLNDLFGEHTAAMDHWIPLSSPDCPGTIPTNIVPLCHGVGGCNNSKHNKLPKEWLVEQFGKRKAKQILERIQTYFEWVKSNNEPA